MPITFFTFSQAPQAQFGVPPDYSAFERDGSLIAYGNATYFRDEIQSLLAARVESPSSDFVLNISEGSITAKTSARYPADYVVTNLQLNHDWLPGTTVYPHLHWWQTTANTPNWLIGWRWQRQGGVQSTSWTNLRWTENVFTWTTGTLNQITRLGSITPADGAFGQVSDILQIRLYRDVTNVSTLFAGNDQVDASQDFVQLDPHIQIDRQGSRQEYTR